LSRKGRQRTMGRRTHCEMEDEREGIEGLSSNERPCFLPENYCYAR
jgi:hypothetical protein